MMGPSDNGTLEFPQVSNQIIKNKQLFQIPLQFCNCLFLFTNKQTKSQAENRRERTIRRMTSKKKGKGQGKGKAKP